MTEKRKPGLKEKQLIIYEEMPKNKSSQAEIMEKAGISRATFYMRKKNYKGWGITGLKELSRRPHRTREKSAITKEAMEKIRQARLEHPMCGKAKIRAALRKAGTMLPGSSTGRALRHFMRRGTVEPVNALKCRKERKIIRQLTHTNAQRIPKGHPDAAGPHDNRHAGRQGVQGFAKAGCACSGLILPQPAAMRQGSWSMC